MALKFLMLLALACSVRAQLPTVGSCPDLKPVENFDVDKFLGRWYEVERYYSVLELATICAKIDYTKGEDGKITAANNVTARLTGVHRVVRGELTLVDAASKTGKLNIRYDQLPVAINSVYSVLATDYTSYAILWSCSTPVPFIFNIQNLWLMTREPAPGKDVTNKAHDYFSKLGIRSGFVQTVDQSCNIPAATPEVPASVAPVVAPVEPEATVIPPAVRNQQVHVKHALDVNTVDVEDSKPVEVAVPADVPADVPKEVPAPVEKEAEQTPVPDVTPEESVKLEETDVVKSEEAEVQTVVEPAKTVEEPKEQ